MGEERKNDIDVVLIIRISVVIVYEVSVEG